MENLPEREPYITTSVVGDPHCYLFSFFCHGFPELSSEEERMFADGAKTILEILLKGLIRNSNSQFDLE